MKKYYLEAYEFYKRQYLGNVILFHIDKSYRAFEDDAIILAAIDNKLACYITNQDGRYYEVSQDRLEEMCHKLCNISEMSVTIVDYRNSQGVFDVPKVKQILADIEDDY